MSERCFCYNTQVLEVRPLHNHPFRLRWDQSEGSSQGQWSRLQGQWEHSLWTRLPLGSSCVQSGLRRATSNWAWQ